ncbi:cleavage and polyadenylation specificity factor subunit [Musa troglodytarum]|uniref:Cleavage and polyadenylation specificity factor subunit n=1 Tax=Musa troglodytarum TaxID=320322 RepID=A0A9E7EMA6_9LILI|nr:cleavage and polyadenylation specificity factor subunit [Musa troglodytarum]
MSYAAFKMMHWPTGIEHCASGFITHSPSDSSPPQIPPAQAEDLDSSEWPTQRRVGPVPNLVVTAANVLEVYLVRIQEDDDRIPRPTGDQHGGGGTMDGLAGARLELVCHYRVVQRLEFMRSKASVLTSVADTEGDLHLAKRLRRTPSDALQEFASGEELSLYTTTPDSSETAQKFFSFIVRDSLINVGPLKDFSYGLRINADPNATGIAKQSNYELVCCSGHGKNGALCVLQQSIRPELITEVLETADDLGEVTETVDYYVQGNTIAAGNLFGRRRVVQIFARGARILDGSYMTQELTFGVHNSELISNSEAPVVASVSIADPYVLLKMTDGSIQLLVGDPSTCTVSVNVPAIFASSTELISACALYHDKGPEPWLRKTSTDAWLSTGIAEAVDGQDGLYNDQGDIYCLVCYESGTLEIFDVPNFKCVFSVDNFVSGKTHLFDKYAREPSRSSQDIKSKVTEEANGSVKKELPQDMKIVELAMQRWSGQYSRPFLFGILSDGTMLCYHAYLYEGLENTPKIEDAVSPHRSAEMGNVSASRLHNLRFIRVSLDMATREEASNVVSRPRITVFKNVGGYQGLFLSGSRPTWFMVVKPLSQVLSSLVDQDTVHLSDNDSVNLDDLQKIYTVDEFEIRILESGKSGGHWETRATIPMQTSENALTVRVVTLFNTTTRENESLLSVGTAYVQGEDVAARGRMLLYSFGKNTENSQNLVSEVYSKELKGAVSALASLQGHLLVASGPKITLHKWTGTELNGIAFYDAPLHVVSLNIVKNFVLLGDIHKSIYFLNWKEQGAQLSLLAKDFGSLDCYATEFLIDGSTLSLVVSDDDKNIQIFYYAPKTLESWKGQKLLPRAEFHAGTHVTKFLRLQMLSTSFDRTNPAPGSDKTNRFALLFSTLDGSIGCIAPLDELTFRRLQTLQRKLVDAVPHTCGLNPRSFRQFRSNGKAHRPGPDNMVDCELLSQYEMLPLGKQLEIAFQIGTTRSQILSNLNDLSLGTSFL